MMIFSCTPLLSVTTRNQKKRLESTSTPEEQVVLLTPNPSSAESAPKAQKKLTRARSTSDEDSNSKQEEQPTKRLKGATPKNDHLYCCPFGNICSHNKLVDATTSFDYIGTHIKYYLCNVDDCEFLTNRINARYHFKEYHKETLDRLNNMNGNFLHRALDAGDLIEDADRKKIYETAFKYSRTYQKTPITFPDGYWNGMKINKKDTPLLALRAKMEFVIKKGLDFLPKLKPASKDRRTREYKKSTLTVSPSTSPGYDEEISPSSPMPKSPYTTPVTVNEDDMSSTSPAPQESPFTSQKNDVEISQSRPMPESPHTNPMHYMDNVDVIPEDLPTDFPNYEFPISSVMETNEMMDITPSFSGNQNYNALNESVDTLGGLLKTEEMFDRLDQQRAIWDDAVANNNR